MDSQIGIRRAPKTADADRPIDEVMLMSEWRLPMARLLIMVVGICGTLAMLFGLFGPLFRDAGIPAGPPLSTSEWGRLLVIGLVVGLVGWLVLEAAAAWERGKEEAGKRMGPFAEGGMAPSPEAGIDPASGLTIVRQPLWRCDACGATSRDGGDGFIQHDRECRLGQRVSARGSRRETSEVQPPEIEG
jgi:hypothetical protein